MSSRHLSRSICRAMVAALAAALLSGCDAYLPGPGYQDVKIPQEKFRRIETLQLQEAVPEPVQSSDADPEGQGDPPAEMELSLEQCRALALTNNLALKARLVDPTIAAERLSEEESKFESSFFTNVNLDKSEVPGGTVVEVGEGIYVPSVGAAKSESVLTNLGVRVPLRTGGTVTLDFADSQTENLSGGGVFNPTYRNQLNMSVSQPLLQNAGRWANTHSIRVAAYNYQMTDARTKLEVIAVLAAVDRVYWRLYAAQKELDVRRQQYDLAQAQLEQVRRFVNAGERSQVEVIRAEAGVAQQLEAIIIGENNLRDRERELKRVINKVGLDMRGPTVLALSTEPDPVRYSLEPSGLVQTAMEARMELLELQLQLLSDASSIDYARNQALPLASLGYTYNISATEASRSDSLDMLFDSEFTGHRLNLQMVVPLGNEVAKSRIRQAIYRRRQRMATRDDRAVLIELEVLNAIDQAEANWQRILAARQNSILNGRLYEAEKRQFELGLRTSTDVLDAQTKFANAQSAEIAALAEYQIALVDLAYATGTVLGAARVQWDPIVPVADDF
ncbi:TolC family protein [Anaerobaca lacustris]|uniref:TolC family protein n=1 Tax=Anaerobaca lacustris TaxID=3044600 RepID=A0AAW6TYS5_9BACT|nr:TolC family protein [Sedimentisphaerales bacterium M17dextr]